MDNQLTTFRNVTTSKPELAIHVKELNKRLIAFIVNDLLNAKLSSDAIGLLLTQVKAHRNFQIPMHNSNENLIIKEDEYLIKMDDGRMLCLDEDEYRLYMDKYDYQQEQSKI